ncbi:MAG: sigma-70 family RNA polymerase sigma factor [Pedobacter sp.]|uniref:sigma-70 family RNA polymerase sigma factor n=1 Tax=Pedobacter sp. TaxID=1411316 RepID=UPI002808684D|nr:sigma-70 family RNA polymerase sigma factor [Pedobacter sp.]MDQ8004584.1 sigma-70 family RNA polymerase sigma factor [Pedobacter sp.]
MSECQQSDEVLWIAVQNSDDKAFNTLYNRYWKKLYATVLHYINDAEIAERVVQDVFVVLWKRRAHLTIESFAKYIHATARYHVFKEVKAKKKTLVEYTDSYLLYDDAATQNSGELKLSYHDFQNQISSYLSPLPKRCKEIFWLSRMENLSNDEIAERFCISKRSVENQITIALKHIRSSNLDIASIALAIALITFT